MPLRKDVKALIFVCALVYVAAYIGRLSYSSSMVAIMEETGSAKDAAGLVTTFYYFAYGCGQVINAFFCRRYKVRPVIAGVLTVSALCNVLVAILRDVSVLKYVWFLNGAAQSVLWCTLIELLSHKVPAEHKNRAILSMSVTVAIGTTSIYTISAACIALGNLFATFWVGAVILIAVVCVWLFITRNLDSMEDYSASAQSASPTQKAGLTLAMIAPILCVGVLASANGFLKDTMVTWVPSLLYDVFGLPSQYSVMITLLLPLFSFFGSALGVAIHKKVCSYYSLLTIMYAASTAALAGVLVSYHLHLIVPVILFAIFNSCFMASVNNVVTSMIPLERKSGSGLFAGLMDAFCYVGSTASGIIPGLILERTQSGFSLLLAIMPAAAIVCALYAILLRLTERHEEKKSA